MSKFIIFIQGKSCTGKSSLQKELGKSYPDSYLVSYDALKWGFAGFNRDTHFEAARQLTQVVYNALCDMGISMLVIAPRSEKIAHEYREKAEEHGYIFIPIHLTAPDDVLIERFRARLKEHTENKRGRMSLTNEDQFRQLIAEPHAVMDDSFAFDTSKISTEQIAQEIMEKL